MRAATIVMAGCALWAAGLGCKKARTETVIVVQTNGVRIPDDVAQIRVTVADRLPSGTNDELYNQTVALCSSTLTTGCYTLPLSAALFPGPKHGVSDSVRVQIDALGGDGRSVTASAALFTFAEGQSQRLDFVLYAACLGVTDCAKRDQACGPDAQCVSLSTTPLHGEPDLGTIGTPGDMSHGATGDMSHGSMGDMSMAPPLDMAGCMPQCGGRTVCEAAQCVACGGVVQPCCTSSAPPCDSLLTCDNGTHKCTPPVMSNDMSIAPLNDMKSMTGLDAI
jgi:hypothetical protein